MKMKTAAYMGVAMLLAGLVFVAVRQGKGQSPADFHSFPWEFVVVDSGGKRVGPVIGTNQGGGITTAAIPFQGKWLPVAVLRSALLSGSLFFTSPDCTGQPFGDGSSSPFPASAVSGHSNTLYFESGPSRTITVGSTLGGGFLCGVAGCTNTCEPATFSLDVVPMAPAIDLNLFIPPFSVVRQARAF
jgi:hypothetical protein